MKIGRQQERITHREAPIADLHLVAVGNLGGGKIVAAVQLDQPDVADRIEPHHHCVVQLAVGHAALHERAAGPGDVKIGQGVSIGRDHDAGAAPLPSRRQKWQAPRASLLRRRQCALVLPAATAGSTAN